MRKMPDRADIKGQPTADVRKASLTTHRAPVLAAERQARPGPFSWPREGPGREQGGARRLP